LNSWKQFCFGHILILGFYVLVIIAFLFLLARIANALTEIAKEMKKLSANRDKE
jgi:preprotein translocase subunit SecY